MCDLYIVDWADLATLDLSLFDQPGGKNQLAKQLFDAIQNIGQYFMVQSSYFSRLQYLLGFRILLYYQLRSLTGRC